MHFAHKPDILNNIFGYGTLFFVFIQIAIFLVLMNQEDLLSSIILPLFILAIEIPIIFVVGLMIISTGVVSLSKKISKKDFSKLTSKIIERRKTWSKAKKDTLRKINHVLIFIGLLVVWYIGLYLVLFFTDSSAGMIPREKNMLFVYLRILNEPNSIREILFSFGWFYYLIFFFFYGLSLFMLVNEFTRKSHIFYFPFNLFPNLYLSDEEKQNYGSYLYFAIGQMFAAFICPPMVFFAILGISSISDLVTSQVGIRFGKSNILWNKKKTWEGSLAGMMSTFLISFLFIGIYWAVIFSLIYLIIDIFTNKPFNLSDNLLIPIGCSLTYILLRFLIDYDYYSIILIWF
jgi:dolichol kinase